MTTTAIRLRKPPKAKKFGSVSKAAKGQAITKVKREIIDQDGKKKIINEVKTVDIAGQIFMSEKTFNDLTDEILLRRAWDNYAYKTVNSINQIGKEDE